MYVDDLNIFKAVNVQFVYVCMCIGNTTVHVFAAEALTIVYVPGFRLEMAQSLALLLLPAAAAALVVLCAAHETTFTSQ